MKKIWHIFHQQTFRTTWREANGTEGTKQRIFFTSIRPQHSFFPPKCGVDSSNTVESSLDEIYVNTRKKRRIHWRWGSEKKKQLFITINKQEGKKEKKLLFVDCNRGFYVAAFPFFFASLCIYRLNKIQMSESTREGLLLHSQSIDVCFFLFFYSSILPGFCSKKK